MRLDPHMHLPVGLVEDSFYLYLLHTKQETKGQVKLSCGAIGSQCNESHSAMELLPHNLLGRREGRLYHLESRNVCADEMFCLE